MRTFMKVSIPVEAGNRAIKDGSLPKTVLAFVEKYKPELVTFTAENGRRTGFFIFDLKEPTMIPSICEPFFMNLNAEITLAPTMNLEEMKAGVERSMKVG